MSAHLPKKRKLPQPGVRRRGHRPEAVQSVGRCHRKIVFPQGALKGRQLGEHLPVHAHSR